MGLTVISVIYIFLRWFSCMIIFVSLPPLCIIIFIFIFFSFHWDLIIRASYKKKNQLKLSAKIWCHLWPKFNGKRPWEKMHIQHQFGISDTDLVLYTFFPQSLFSTGLLLLVWANLYLTVQKENSEPTKILTTSQFLIRCTPQYLIRRDS